MEDNPSILDAIRAGCARVAALADDIAIDVDRLDAFVDELPIDRLERPSMDDEHHFAGRGQETVAYILILDAINFGSGYFPKLQPLEGRTGYFLVARALRDHFAEKGPISAEELKALTAEDCASLFGQRLDEPEPRELMEHFATALRDLGALVLERYQGRFTALVEAADHSASRLVEILSQMPLYRDVAKYRGFEVPLFKRAQITVADLHLGLSGEGWGHFEDLHQLTMFADNQVPHVLRVNGILHYSEHLASLIESGVYLERDSSEEVEIRACGLHAVDLIVDRLAEKGVDTTAMAVDNYLWDIGEYPPYTESAKHRTKTTYY